MKNRHLKMYIKITYCEVDDLSFEYNLKKIYSKTIVEKHLTYKPQALKLKPR